jgi:hypothetical protein
MVGDGGAYTVFGDPDPPSVTAGGNGCVSADQHLILHRPVGDAGAASEDEVVLG